MLRESVQKYLGFDFFQTKQRRLGNFSSMASEWCESSINAERFTKFLAPLIPKIRIPSGYFVFLFIKKMMPQKLFLDFKKIRAMLHDLTKDLVYVEF